MSVLTLLNNVKESNIYKLTYDNKPVGLRIKYFNTITAKFDYYDFELDTIGSSQELRDYINSIQKDLLCIPLKEMNGLLISEEEIKNNIVISEFKDTNQAKDIIQKIKLIREV